MNKELNEAAEKQWSNISRNAVLAYIDGATSDAAKEHWYAQWQAEQKQVLPDYQINYYEDKVEMLKRILDERDKEISKLQQKQVPTDEEIEELWDSNSVQIGDTIDELQYYADRLVMTESDFKKAIKSALKL